MTVLTLRTRKVRMTLAEHREAVRATLDRYGASNPRIFGSVAHGDATADSDLDLLIDLAKPLGLFALARLEHELSAILGIRVEVVPADSLREHLRAAVLAEAVGL